MNAQEFFFSVGFSVPLDFLNWADDLTQEDIVEAIRDKIWERYGDNGGCCVTVVPLSKEGFKNSCNCLKTSELPSSKDGQNTLVESINALRDSVEKLNLSIDCGPDRIIK